jgi:acyl-CoA thioester hydrolase
MSSNIYVHPITIIESDIDGQGHVNNIIYLKWVQEAAIAHWTSVADINMQESNFWVVSRHEIDYLKSAYLNSKLVAKTWVTEPQGAKSERYVAITDAETETVYANIKTTFYLLDAKSKRPKRIDAEIVNVFS